MSLYDSKPPGYRPGLYDPIVNALLDRDRVVNALAPNRAPRAFNALAEALKSPPSPPPRLNRLLQTPTPPVPNVEIVEWPGESGARYRSQLYGVGTVFPIVAGVYIFCHRLPNGKWYALYVGECEDFRDRLYDRRWSHHHYPEALNLGATHICVAHVAGGKASRVAVETDLRRRLDPPLNRQ